MPVWLQPFPLGVPDRLSQREAFPHSLVDTIVQREEKQYIRKRPIQRVRSRWGTAQIHCQVGPASIQQSFNILLCCTRTRTCTRECKHDEKAGLPRHWEREREREATLNEASSFSSPSRCLGSVTVMGARLQRRRRATE